MLHPAFLAFSPWSSLRPALLMWLGLSSAAAWSGLCAEEPTTEDSTAITANAAAEAPAKPALLVEVRRFIPKESGWELEVGVAWRNFGGLEFHRSSEALAQGLPVLVELPGQATGPAGPADGYAARSYRDGFVAPDFGTALGGETSNFRTLSGSQKQGGDFVFHGVSGTYSSFSQTMMMGTESWSSDVAALGPVVNWRRSGKVSEHWTTGIELGGGLWVAGVADESRAFTVRQTARTYQTEVTDRYADLGGQPPLISAIPVRSRRDRLVRESTAVLEGWFQDELDLALTTVSAGPTAAWQRGPLSVRLGLGLALNLAVWKAEQTERLQARTSALPAIRTVARWRHESSGAELLPGFYLRAGVGWQVSKSWAVRVDGRYDWSRALEGEVGGSSFTLGMDGWTLALMVQHSF